MGDRKLRLVVGQRAERAVKNIRRDVVGNRDVRVVVELRDAAQRATPHRPLDPLAVTDAGGQGDEHHRRDRPETAGAAQLDVERPLLRRHQLEMILDRGELLVVELGRRDQRDVRRDRQRERVAEPFAPGRELGAERFGQADSDPDRVVTTTQRAQTFPGRNPTRSRTSSMVATATVRARSAPAARMSSRASLSSR